MEGTEASSLPNESHARVRASSGPRAKGVGKGKGKNKGKT